MASNYPLPEPLVQISKANTSCFLDSSAANRARVFDASHHSNLSLDISLDDVFELTGDFVVDELCAGSTNEIIDKDVIHTLSSSATAPIGKTVSPSRSSFVRFWNNDAIDFGRLGNNFNVPAEIQLSSPVTTPAPTQSQSPFDPPPTRRFSSSYDFDYYDYLKTLVPRMETSEQSRSKVRMLLMQQEQPQERLFASKLAATGLDTTKSEETRNMLLQAHCLGKPGNIRWMSLPLAAMLETLYLTLASKMQDTEIPAD